MKTIHFLLLLCLLLSACAPATQAPPTLPPAPSVTPSQTPRPGKTKFIMPPVPLYGSKTPTPPPTMLPTVTPLALKEFTILNVQTLVPPKKDSFKVYQGVELAIQTDG